MELSNSSYRQDYLWLLPQIFAVVSQNLVNSQDAMSSTHLFQDCLKATPDTFHRRCWKLTLSTHQWVQICGCVIQCILSYQITCYANSYWQALVFIRMSAPWLFMCEPVAFHQQCFQKGHILTHTDHTVLKPQKQDEKQKIQKREKKMSQDTCGINSTSAHACIQ